MQPEALAEAREWLGRAKRDLLAAERSLQGQPPLMDVAVFHAQQATEKALKAYLTAHGQTFPKTHDLVPLLSSCQAIDSEFGGFSQAALALTPYAVRFRYPGGPLEPEEAEARQAHQWAGEIVEFAASRLGSDGEVVR
jgi:HEPN domain-containing protein